MRDHSPRRQVMGPHAPGAAAAQELEDGVQDLSRRVGFPSAAWFGFWNQMVEQVPFVLTEIGRVCSSGIHLSACRRLRSANATFWTPSQGASGRRQEMSARRASVISSGTCGHAASEPDIAVEYLSHRKTMINARIASTHDQRPAASSMEDLAA